MDFETNYDKLLQISTCGRDDSNADACHHPYEPTPYRVLERLEGCGLLRQGDTLLDYAQAGIGSNSCGPALHEKYRISEKEFDFEFSVKPENAGNRIPEIEYSMLTK